MLIASGILAVVGVGLLLVGLLIWLSKYDVTSTLLIILGAILVLIIAPWIASFVESPSWYDQLMWFTWMFNWVVFLILAILLCIDGYYAAIPGYEVQQNLSVEKKAGAKSQVQAAAFCFLGALVLFGLAILFGVRCVQYHTTPDVDPMFVQLQQATQGSTRLQVISLEPLEIYQDASDLSETEKQRWIQLTQDAYKTKEGDSTLVVEEIFAIWMKSKDGIVIDTFTVEFRGKYDKPEGQEDELLPKAVYGFHSGLDYSATKAWVDEELAQYALNNVTRPSAVAPKNTPKPQNAPSAASPLNQPIAPPRSRPLGIVR